MTLLVTGATGFVMSVLTRRWLESHVHERAVILDSAGLDETAKNYFAPVADRLQVVRGDVTDRETWQALSGAGDIAYAVHGATITPIANKGAGGVSLDPEAEGPRRIIEVNVMGTVAALEWARTQPRLRRFIYVSSGSVYKSHGPDRPSEPLPEDGYVMPRRLYAISKFTSELITERYAELFGLPIASVRLSSVYGPMDRATSTRDFRHAERDRAQGGRGREARAGQTVFPGVGDYIYLEDVANAAIALLEAPSLGYSVPQHRGRHDGHGRGSGAMGGGEIARVPCDGGSLRRGRDRPGRYGTRRNVGRVRPGAHLPRYRMEASAGSRGISRLHRLARNEPRTGRALSHDTIAGRKGCRDHGR